MDNAIIAVLISVGFLFILNLLGFAYFTGRSTKETEHLRLSVEKLTRTVKENNHDLWEKVIDNSESIVSLKESTKSAHTRLDKFEKRLEKKGA